MTARRPGCRARLPAGSARPAARDENSDAAVAAEFTAAEAAAGQHGPLTWYGDSAYGTGELRAAVAAAGHRAVIKPKPLLPAVPGGFTADDFAVDAAAGTVTCPAGITRHITPRGRPSSGLPAAAVRSASAAPPPGTAAPSTCTNTTACSAPPARTGPACARTTRRTGQTSSAPSPRSPPGAVSASSSATAASPRTTPGSGQAPPPSTSASSSAAASPAATASGPWPPDQRHAGRHPAARKADPTAPAGLLRTSHGQPTAARQAYPPPRARVPRKPPRPRTLPNSAAS